jgi:hypothetical protein
MRTRDAKGAHILNQFDDPQFTIEKDHIDCEEHPESVNAIAGAQQKCFSGGEAAAEHQSAKPLEKCVGKFDALSETLACRSMVNLHFVSGAITISNLNPDF